LTDQVFVTLDRGDYILDGSNADPELDLLIDVDSYENTPESPILSTTARVNLAGIQDSFFITFDSQVNAFGFTGQWVSQVEILADTACTFHAFDNVSYATTDVPAPKGILLMGFVLIGLGLLKRK
jgi:hypothetical protein